MAFSCVKRAIPLLTLCPAQPPRLFQSIDWLIVQIFRGHIGVKHGLNETILEILSQCVDLKIATVRPNGAPQATVVSFVHDGLLLYFACAADSQKANNVSDEPRVSLTMTVLYEDWMAIKGLSISAIAERIDDAKEISEVGNLVLKRFPQAGQLEPAEWDEISFPMLRSQFISVLDDTRGLGHTDLVEVAAEDIAETLETTRHRWLVP